MVPHALGYLRLLSLVVRTPGYLRPLEVILSEVLLDFGEALKSTLMEILLVSALLSKAFYCSPKAEHLQKILRR